VLGRSGVAILQMALDGEGWRDDSSKAREGASMARDGATATRRRGTARRYGDKRRAGYTTVRDGTALRRWGAVVAPRRRGKARARQGTARRLHDGEGRRGICAPGK